MAKSEIARRKSVYVVVEPVKNPNNNFVGKSFIGKCNFQGKKGNKLN